METYQSILDLLDRLNDSDLSKNPAVVFKSQLREYLSDVFSPEQAVEVVMNLNINFGPQENTDNPVVKAFISDLVERLGTLVLKMHNEFIEEFGWNFFIHQVKTINLDLS